jgi:arginine/glutamate-rich protein 1
MEIEVNKRVEEIVTKRLAEQAAKYELLIEQEVQKRLVEARKLIEKSLADEFEFQRQTEFKSILEKEVNTSIASSFYHTSLRII